MFRSFDSVPTGRVSEEEEEDKIAPSQRLCANDSVTVLESLDVRAICGIPALRTGDPEAYAQNP